MSPKKQKPTTPSAASEWRTTSITAGLAEALDLLLYRVECCTVPADGGGRRVMRDYKARTTFEMLEALELRERTPPGVSTARFALAEALDAIIRDPCTGLCDRAFWNEALPETLDDLEVGGPLLALLQGTVAGHGEPFGWDVGDVIPAETLDALREAKAALAAGPQEALREGTEAGERRRRRKPGRKGWINLSDAARKYEIPYPTLHDRTLKLPTGSREKANGFAWVKEAELKKLLTGRGRM